MKYQEIFVPHRQLEEGTQAFRGVEMNRIGRKRVNAEGDTAIIRKGMHLLNRERHGERGAYMHCICIRAVARA